MDSEKVAGQCPMGCGETLFLGEGGHVTCSVISCPDPGAADRALTGRAVGELRWLVVEADRATAADARIAELGLFERALIIAAFDAGQAEVLNPLRKAIGTAAETVGASAVWGAIGGRSNLDYILHPDEILRSHGESSIRSIVDSALRRAAREEDAAGKEPARATD